MKPHEWPVAVARYVLRHPNSSSGRSEKHVRVQWVPTKCSVVLWPWSYSCSNRAAYIYINCRRAVKTMPVHTWQGVNQRTHDLWHTSCDLLLMRENLQFLNVCDVLYMSDPIATSVKNQQISVRIHTLGFGQQTWRMRGFKHTLQLLA